MVSAALGTQVIGSILRPASFCRCIGFKSSVGASTAAAATIISARAAPACSPPISDVVDPELDPAGIVEVEGLAIPPVDNFGHGDPMVLEPLIGGVKFHQALADSLRQQEMEGVRRRVPSR